MQRLLQLLATLQTQSFHAKSTLVTIEKWTRAIANLNETGTDPTNSNSNTLWPTNGVDYVLDV
jgi:hypothetical protein